MDLQVFSSSVFSSDTPDHAFDGIISYGETPRNRWAPFNSQFEEDWIEWGFPEPRALTEVGVHFFEDGGGMLLPTQFRLEYKAGDNWVPVRGEAPQKPVAGAVNRLAFAPVTAQSFRLVLTHRRGAYSGITEIEYTLG